MKIHIWITRKNAMEGSLDPADYYIRKPRKSPRFWDYVQVSITPDEFTILEDCNDFMHNQLNDWKSDYWLKEQYNVKVDGEIESNKQWILETDGTNLLELISNDYIV